MDQSRLIRAARSARQWRSCRARPRAFRSIHGRWRKAICSSPSKGENGDGHDYVRAAFEKGAMAAVVEEAKADALKGLGPLYVVRDVSALARKIGPRARGHGHGRGSSP